MRRVASLAVVALVAAAGLWLWLWVGVAERFEGRLWRLPSKVWSDILVVSVGSEIAPDALEGRLVRSGYARTPERPERPGQFRRVGDRLDVNLRPFATPATRSEGEFVSLHFSAGRVAGIRGARGLPARHVIVEPELLATLFGSRHEERQPLALDQVPESLIRAVLAAEDSRFQRHGGLDLRGIARAALANLRNRSVVQGGSTITQQTVKNLYLGQQRTWWRKAREAVLAIVLDARYPKERILEVYLNDVYLGQRGAVAICGVQAASRHYFGRDVADLTPGEHALLAGMIRSPGAYNPFSHRERALARRDQVLGALVRLEWMAPDAAERARAEPLRLAGGAPPVAAPWVADLVRARLGERYADELLEGEGLQIHTTVDTAVQVEAERALRRGLERLEREVGSVRAQLATRQLEGAVLVTRPASGEILAVVGGRDWAASQFNRATRARRQPGSCFKPFVFAAGFEQAAQGGPGSLTPATLLDDSPLELTSGGRPWRPENYDRRFRGPVTVRDALEGSLNVPTVRAARIVGLERVVDLAHRAGIESPLRPLPSLALGAAEVTPLELATAYGTFAEGGIRAEPWIIRSVADRHGNVLEGRRMSRRRVLDEQTAYLVTDLLRGVLVRGTARSAAALGYGGDAAGKTGTTDDTRDAWFVGYTPDVLALVWVGYDDNEKTGLTGATGALPIWVDVMRAAAPGHGTPFAAPRGLVTRRIDPTTGQLAVERCPESVEQTFLSGSEPLKECTRHQAPLKRWWRKLRGRDD